MNPRIIKSGIHIDNRGIILHNNEFDLSPIKRIYIIQNSNLNYLRGWKGHLIENRWFLCVKGIVGIYVAKISDLNKKNKKYSFFELNENDMNVLYVPSGNATLIKQISQNSRLMAFSDWLIGESNDEDCRWPNNIIEL